MWDKVALIIGSYLLGSFPLLYLLGRLHGVDLRKYDDMHIALWRSVGRVEGFVGVTFDFAKAVIVVLLARNAGGFDPGWVAFAGVAAVAGQMWPVFLKFDGERGNSIGLAMSGAVATCAMFIALVPVVIGAAVRTIPRFLQRNQNLSEKLKFGGPPSLSLPLGMAGFFAVLPLTAWAVGQPWEVTYSFIVLFVMIMLRRLTAKLREDMRKPSWRNSMLLNRLLFDRSEI